MSTTEHTKDASPPPAPAPSTGSATEDELNAAKAVEIAKLRADYTLYSHTQRLGMPPVPRIALTVLAGGTYGAMSGFYGGFKRGSLEFLALNAHRLPRTKGGWYFYHKRKNYVMLKSGLASGIKGALKYGGVTGTYFAVEAAVDWLRGDGGMDFGSTTLAATTVGTLYALWNRLSRVQTRTAMKNAFVFGLVMGVVQDGLRYARGNDIWYLPKHILPVEESEGKELKPSV